MQRQARAAYKQFLRDPFHPSLRFKRVHADKPVYSIRISRDYRCLGIHEGDVIVWFWIGSHSDYEKLLASL